jgi:hypothetical protein
MRNKFFLIPATIFLVFNFFLACNSRLETKRHHLDTTFFTGKNPNYEPQIRSEIMKTEAYHKFLTTTNLDSLSLYLIEAETEVFKKLNIK